MAEGRRTYFHICNPATLEGPGWMNICSQEELEKIEVENEYAVIVLNIHLNWGGRRLGSDYGFEVANHIRINRKSLLPIVFYSYIRKEYFEYKSMASLKYNLLFGRGAAFLEAPFSNTRLTETVDNLPPLSQSSLHDVVTMLADVKGIVLDKLNHNLKFGSDPLRHFSEVEPYLTERQKALVGFEEYRQRLIKLSTENDESSFYDTKEAFLSICNTNLTMRGKGVAEPPPTRHKILIVEDVQAELENACAFLGKNFSVISARDGDEAIGILKEDVSNDILAVVSDWRLYTDEAQTYWQKYQGYEVLEAASKTGIRALFALTSQADFVVHHIRNSLGFKFSLLKKQNLRSPEQWSLLSDLIDTGCADVLSTLSEMPSSKSWYNKVNGVSYRELYIREKQSINSAAYFASVTDKADEVWDYLMKEKETKFKNIRLIKETFGLEVPTKLNLATVLVLRLAWMGLWHKLKGESNGVDPDESEDKLLVKVFKIICKGNYGYPTDSEVNVELNKICLKQKDFPARTMLPHERAWLHRKGLLTSTK